MAFPWKLLMLCRDGGRTVLIVWALTFWAAAAEAAPKEIEERITDDPKILAAVDRGRQFLRSSPLVHRGSSLIGLALLKSGETVQTPVVAEAIEIVQQRVADGVYTPDAHHFYTAGLDMMLLETADPDLYRPELEAITKYIIAGQTGNGSWYYPDPPSSSLGGGDTSISQYAMLGLWSATRAGIEVPVSVWDRAVAWHVKSQHPTGAFFYHPYGGRNEPPKRTMAAAAVGSLYIARRHMYPDEQELKPVEEPVERVRKKIPFLEPINLDDPDAPADKKKPAAPGKPTVPLGAIDRSIEKGIGWLGANWKVDNDDVTVFYYLYAVERMAALADTEEIGGHDWYAEASDYLLKSQDKDGSWRQSYNNSIDTSFALLALGRATARALNRAPRGIDVGAGLLAGGRGLPDNLAQVQVAGGEVKARKLAGPIDELLAELENPKSLKVESVQAAVLERVQFGDRDDLIGQTERLEKLAKDPRAEVRRTALWALGRSGDLRYVPLMIEALQDNNLDVVVEARNALCTLSRKPNGFGLPDDPFAALPENADERDRERAVAQWRKELISRWMGWQRSVRPYEQRDGLAEHEEE